MLTNVDSHLTNQMGGRQVAENNLKSHEKELSESRASPFIESELNSDGHNRNENEQKREIFSLYADKISESRLLNTCTIPGCAYCMTFDK
jgi:hypothetical protein